MRVVSLTHHLASHLLRYLVPLALLSTIYVYYYPSFNPNNCSFAPRNTREPGLAPFRLLAFGDPQLEGSSSIPSSSHVFSSALAALEPLRVSLSLANESHTTSHASNGTTSLTAQAYPAFDVLHVLFNVARAAVTRDVPRFITRHRKRLDLLGNDLYLAHIFRTIHSHSQPTHTVVLGDLLGSQWISDAEFAARSTRYWDVVFRGTERAFSAWPNASQEETDRLWDEWLHYLQADEGATSESHMSSWSTRLMNIPGNHDVGYAGDLDVHRTVRYERTFGPLNWRASFDLINPAYLEQRRPDRLQHPDRPSLEIVGLNSMNLDSPAFNKDMQRETWAFVNQTAADFRSHATRDLGKHAMVMLTHIPLYKREGLCTDGPFFDYFPDENGNGVKEQNHLGANTSERVLQVYGGEGMRLRAGVLLNGHDHEGCDVLHAVTEAEGDNSGIRGWTSARTGLSQETVATNMIREITVRSMMGDYSGNAGLLSGWYDDEAARWVFEYRACRFGKQHLWWAVHILDIVTAMLSVVVLLRWIAPAVLLPFTTLRHIWTDPVISFGSEPRGR